MGMGANIGEINFFLYFKQLMMIRINSSYLIQEKGNASFNLRPLGLKEFICQYKEKILNHFQCINISVLQKQN